MDLKLNNYFIIIDTYYNYDLDFFFLLQYFIVPLWMSYYVSVN